MSAERGARWLDGMRSEWFLEVDPNVLNMRDPNLCVIGQIGKAMLAHTRPDGDPWIKGLSFIGMNVDSDDALLDMGMEARYPVTKYGQPEDQYAQLTDDWRDQILMRQMRETVRRADGNHGI